MALQLSRREVEDLRSSLDRAIYRTIGKSDNSLLSTVSSCLTNGYERRKIIDKISSHIDSKKASKLADKVIALAEESISNSKSSSQKRKHDSDSSRDKDSKKSRSDKDKYESRHERDRDRSDSKHESKEVKESKDKESQNGEKKVTVGNGVDVEASLSSSESVGSKIAGLSADRIKLMMANAQKEIEERKRTLVALTGNRPTSALEDSASTKPKPGTVVPPKVVKPTLFSKPESSKPVTADDLMKQQKIAELQARIQRKLAGGALAAGSSGSGAGGAGPAPLILDRDGMAVDNTGKRVQLTTVAPTLKANIRAQRREQFRAQLSGPVSPGAGDRALRWSDPRLETRAPVRGKRQLRFHEPGKFTQLAERLRMKAQLEKLQSEISQIARKTGISSATKLALLTAESGTTDTVPDIEWWDSVILLSAEEAVSCGIEPEAPAADRLNHEAITELVEHPQQLRPPTESVTVAPVPLFLTASERRKLRRQARRERWKEEQEKVRLGLEPPPEPKLRISNLMRALGTEAVQDPTAIEAKVREQVAKRQKTHQEANQARALTKEQRKEKIDRKIREDTSMGVHVGVYRITDLFECASAKFKVERNAAQLHMSCCVLLHRGCCLVVCEGGKRQHEKYKRLMLHRIKWEESTVKDAEGRDVKNSCRLVWEGVAQKRAFTDVKFKVMPTEKMAREFFQKHGVEHYWDLAYSGAVLGPSVEQPL